MRLEEIKELLINFALAAIGIYGKVHFGGRKYTKGQKAAMVLVCVAVAYLLHLTNLSTLYQNGICILCGLSADTLIKRIPVIISKTIRKSEDKVADKLSDKIDNSL